MITCRYHEDYGGGRNRGAHCFRAATLRLRQEFDDKTIDLCWRHAFAITKRYPQMGGMERFERIPGTYEPRPREPAWRAPDYKQSSADREPKNQATTCECGRPKSKTEIGCERCMFLDGRGAERGEARIISALRDHGAMSLKELAHATKSSERHTHTLLHKMLKRGRLSRYWEESNAHEVSSRDRRYYGRWCSEDHRAWMLARACWIYRLAARPERRCQTGALASSA